MNKPRFDPKDLPDLPVGDKPDPSASYIDVGEDSPDTDLPVDPITGRPGNADEPEFPALAKPAEKSTRPPWWLVAFTLLIPLAVFAVWYLNWFGRPLSVATMNDYLTSSNDKDVAHALIQIAKQAQDAAEEARGNQQRLDIRYKGALEEIRGSKQGPELAAAIKELEEQRLQSSRNIDEQHSRAFSELELTFEGVLNLVRNAKSRAPALIEAACGALGVMHRSTRFREPARTELVKLMRHESKVVQRAAACNLASFGDRSGRDFILEMLDDSDPAARANGAIALSRVGLQSDAQRLKQLSEKDPDAKVREFAYQGYAALQGKVD